MKHLAWMLLAAAVLPVACSCPKDLTQEEGSGWQVDPDFLGRLEYAVEAIGACGLTPADIWFPSMSIRSSRPVVLYDRFSD